MFAALFAFALLPAPFADDPAPQPVPAPATVPCRAKAQLADGPAQPPRMRTLAEEPPAQEYRTVLRIENGCSVPVKTSERVIGNPALR